MNRILSTAKYTVRVLLAFKDFLQNYGKIMNAGGGKMQIDTYYPEYADRRKSALRIFFDQIGHIFKYSYCNYFYFTYGFDIKGLHQESDYVDYTVFMRQRNKMNAGRRYSRVAVLRDKALFDIVATRFGFNTPHVLGLLTEDMKFLSYSDNVTCAFSDWLRQNDVDAYLKVVDGECADGVFHIVVCKGKVLFHGTTYTIEDFVKMLPKRTRFILQQKMSDQHEVIKAIHPQSVNTLRIVTVINPATNFPVVLSVVLRVGAKDNEEDNWAIGGLSIGVDKETQKLRKYGYYKPGFGTKATEHPDSHIVFEGYKVPFLNEAISEAIRFHGLLSGIHSIGWDVAITEKGPCFIEGNDNWEISLMQLSNHGLQKEFNQLFYA